MMQIRKPWQTLGLIKLVLLTLTLGGCSGSDSASDTDQAKVLVNAGADTTVNEQTTISLSGQAQGQTAELTFAWKVTPSLAIEHPDNLVADATFVTPSTSQVLSYLFVLEVIDGLGNRGSDSVTYTVAPVNELPRAIITLAAYPSLPLNTFPAGIALTLDGRNSDDVDSGSTDMPIAAYKWQQTAGQSVMQGLSTESDTLRFISPILEQDNNLSFRLTVSDDEGAQASQDLTLTILSESNTQPSVEAGIDHSVFSGESINLQGIAATSIPSARPLSYFWLNDSQLLPNIDDNQALKTFAVAPLVNSDQRLTFTLEVTDVYGHNVEDDVSVMLKPLPLTPLNDTGVLQEATLTTITNVHQGDYPGQDGQRGRDRINASVLLEKAGRGAQGFDYTRLDEFGDEVDDPSAPWVCVRDNVSGLIWEVKTDTSDLTSVRSAAHTYGWLKTTNNGGYAGVTPNPNASCSLTSCETASYVAAINALALCNYRDWRLPTRQELQSIVHFGQSSGGMIDTDYFPNTTEQLTPPVWYWSSDSSADGEPGQNAQNAWVIDFASANDNFLNKDSARRIRLVRAGR